MGFSPTLVSLITKEKKREREREREAHTGSEESANYVPGLLQVETLFWKQHSLESEQSSAVQCAHLTHREETQWR